MAFSRIDFSYFIFTLDTMRMIKKQFLTSLKRIWESLFLLFYCLALQKATAEFLMCLYSVYCKIVKLKKHCFSIAFSLLNYCSFYRII